MTQQLLRRLDARDQRVVFLRYVHEWTQKSIADELGVTQMQVSRILARIHHQLRAELTETQAASEEGSEPRSGASRVQSGHLSPRSSPHLSSALSG